MANYRSNSGGNAIIAVGFVFIVLDFLFVGLRLWARRLKRTTWKLSDYLILAALVSNCANLGVGVALVLDGAIGLPVIQATEEEVVTSLKLFLAATILWSISICLIKLSVLSFYHDVIDHRIARINVYVLSILSLMEAVAVILGVFLICRPFALNWDITIKGTCGDRTENFRAIAILNMILDFLVVLMPMPFLWNLQMATHRKVAISLILCLGLVVSVFSALRIWAINHIDLVNFTGTVVNDVLFAALEILLGVITACLPLIQPPMAQAFGKDSAVRSLLRFTGRSTSSGMHTGNSKNDFLPDVTIGSAPRKFHRLEHGDSQVELVEFDEQRLK